jgi:6,7-dimethyl-8-ribityllumazine synthase
MQNAQNKSFELFDASKYKVGVVVAQFNSGITEQLLASALQMLEKYGVAQKNIIVKHVAGSVEIPVVLNAMAKTKKFNCLVALGTVIRGDTSHYDYVCKIVSDGVLRVMLDYTLPVGFGILTTENEAQAQARVGSGGGAVEAALHAAKEINTL